MSNFVFVIDTNKQQLNPVHPGQARRLLKQQKAAIYRRYPLTIVLKRAVSHPQIQPHQLKIDPGSKVSGLAIVRDNKVIWGAELTHRGQQIKNDLESRRAIRRHRRNRKTRYRKPRFLNRTRKQGWLPPSRESRIENILTWINRIRRYVPLAVISQELVKFDTLAIQNPEISGVGYQQGELAGYEIREYLLEKWGRKCAYCNGVTVNSQGQVELTNSGLLVENGYVVAKGVSAQTATLSANRNLTLVESQLSTTGDLNLLANDTVRVRDSVANSFVANAGGNLYIQGNRSIDILALNHSDITPFQSGANLTIVSDGNISGDAHFAAGGSFFLLNLSGNPGNFVSLYDPIISSNGDVTFANYVGAALKIEAKGSIIGGDIIINGPDTPTSIPASDPHFNLLTTSPALILQAGKTALDNPAATSSGVYNVPPNSPSLGNTVFSSSTGPTLPGNIRIGNMIPIQNQNGGPVIMEATGNITTGSLTSSSERVDNNNAGNGSAITLKAGGSINITGSINSLSSASPGNAGNGGAISLLAGSNINITENLNSSSFSYSGNAGNGGTITINAPNGSIAIGSEPTRMSLNSSALINGSELGNTGNGGAIIINAANDINIPGSLSLFSSHSGTVGKGGTLTIISTNGNVTTNAIDTNGVDINLTSRNGTITTGSLDTLPAYVNSSNAGNITLRANNGIKT